MNRETLETHSFKCSTCGASFESRDRNQLGSVRRGRNVYCGDKCRSEMDIELQRHRPGRHICGPCPTCRNTFQSKTKGKRFCSLECYTKSEELLSRLAKNNAAKAKEWKCHYCDEDAPRKRKFCNDFCRRRFFAERFDRFIANPEVIALPQNFDEFLSRDELPCLIEGCDWVGVGLSHHVNFCHGIEPDSFREMVGFNRTTALMGVAARQTRSEVMHELIEKGVITPCAFPVEQCSRERGSARLEGVEHWKKAMAIGGGMQRMSAAAAEWARSPEGRQVLSETAKRTAEQMPKITLSCQECNGQYETPQNQKNRSRFCGLKCRNANARKRRQRHEVNKE